MKPMSLPRIDQLDVRSTTVFRHLVEEYLETGNPVGSRNLSKQLPIKLSPASVRNVMADLEAAGLIYAPHTSAGRMPTQQGLRLFVDGMLETGGLSHVERASIQEQVRRMGEDRSVDDVLNQATEMISGLSLCAGLVLADKQDAPLRHIQFVPLEETRALAILVHEDGHVENRVIDLPAGLPPSALTEASNYLSHHIRGLTLTEVRAKLQERMDALSAEVDTLTKQVVEAGVAVWSGADDTGKKNLIVRGQSHLLADVQALDQLDRIRQLFNDIETQADLVNLLGLAECGDGVKIFIGSESKLFSLSGSSLIVAPFAGEDRRIVGVLGVIGPQRLNYGRIIPMVDYTARLVSRLVTS